MADRRCCCQEGCWVFSDDFNDPNSTDLGTSWYEDVGDWGISGFVLVEDYSTGTDGTANAVLVCTEQQPAAHAGQQYLSIQVQDPQPGDFYYLYLCAVSPTSSSGSVEVEFECTTSSSNWVVRCGGESQTYISVLPDVFGMVTLGACVDKVAGMMKASVNPSPEEDLWNDGVSPGVGRYSAIGHNNINHLNIFDNFSVGELISTDGTECNDCFCRCLEDAMPKRLTLTVTMATDRAECAGGYTCNMDWEWNSGVPQWRGSYTVVYGGNSQFFEWCLECTDSGDTDPANPGQNFSLHLCNATGCASTWPSGSTTVWEPLQGDDWTTCTPLRLVFGPMTVGFGDFTCWMCYPPGTPFPPDPDSAGEFYIEITL